MLLALALTDNARGGGEPPDWQFKVRDAAGKPVAGAWIWLDGVTDAKGEDVSVQLDQGGTGILGAHPGDKVVRIRISMPKERRDLLSEIYGVGLWPKSVEVVAPYAWTLTVNVRDSLGKPASSGVLVQQRSDGLRIAIPIPEDGVLRIPNLLHYPVRFAAVSLERYESTKLDDLMLDSIAMPGAVRMDAVIR